MIVRRKRIQLLAEELLRDAGAKEPPVPLEHITKQRRIPVYRQTIPDSDISGFLIRRGTDILIGVNDTHSMQRQRFTLAHEIGHILLHKPNVESVHVDRGFEVRFRDERSSLGVDVEEREANLFAAELLMPRHFIAKDIANISQVDLVDDKFISRLARRYRVSNQALLFRLANLGYVKL